jgi:AcrR family transcriptional regulator
VQFVVRQYHDSMRVPSQGGSADSGRVNQKRRTRAAIVAAAKELLDGGVTPTVAQAAEAALVGRTTAYRYFPTQESLLIEVALNLDVDEIEQLVARSPDEDDPRARTLAVLDALCQHAFDAEAQYRTALRLYLDLWLAAVAAGETDPVVREGRRRRWLEQCLEPVRDQVDPAALDRLLAALCLLGGGEAMVVLRDVCGLDVDDGREIIAWAADTLLRATFDGPGGSR